MSQVRILTHRGILWVTAVILVMISNRSVSARTRDFSVSRHRRVMWSGKLAEPGENDGPFATIGRAQQATREIRKMDPQAAVRVIILGGTKLFISDNWGPRCPTGCSNDWTGHGVNTWDYYELNSDGSTHVVDQARYDAGKPSRFPPLLWIPCPGCWIRFCPLSGHISLPAMRLTGVLSIVPETRPAPTGPTPTARGLILPPAHRNHYLTLTTTACLMHGKMRMALIRITTAMVPPSRPMDTQKSKTI